MRDRAWRRHIEEVSTISRLRNITFRQTSWYFIEDANKNFYKKAIIVDFLERIEYFKAKTISTDKWDTKHKVKYSPNRSKPYYRDGKKKFSTREFDKVIFRKILKENGLK